MLKKITRFIKHPIKELHPARELIRRTIFIYSKLLCEFFYISRYSKPYPHHQELIRIVNLKNGFFVECGGNDGYFQDPTYYLEKFNRWKGIIVEPLPIYKICQKNRSKSVVFNYAAGTPAQSHKLVKVIDCGPMSMVKSNVSEYAEWTEGAKKCMGLVPKEINVQSRTLDEIIEEYFEKNDRKKIDLLILDVEGAEMAVLEGFSIEKYHPTYILIELQDDKRRKLIEEKMKGYKKLANFENNDYLYSLHQSI